MTINSNAPRGITLQRDPIRFVDVGARGGWPPGWRASSEYVHFIGFEPDTDECNRLQKAAKRNELYIPQALYSEPGPVDLFHCRPGSLTSLYPPNLELAWLWDKVEGLVRREQITATTLDLALAERNIHAIDFIKLDTQGSELDILRGGERLLAAPLLGIELEVEFAPVYSGQPLFSDIDPYLRERDFVLIDFIRTFSRADIEFSLRGMKGYSSPASFLSAWTGKVRAPSGAYRGGKQLIYGDALYLRKPEALLAAVERAGLDPYRQLLKAATICSIIAYEDAAQPYLDIGVQRGIFTATDIDMLQGMLISSSQRRERVIADIKRLAGRLQRHLLRSRR